MEQHFYIGTMEIIYHVDQEFSLENFDSLFLQPVLPIESCIHVFLRWVDTLDTLPEEAAHASTHHFLAWQTDNDERRVYLRWEKTPLLASHLNASQKQVYITTLQDGREEILKRFRPWFNIHLERLQLWNRAIVLHSASIIYRGEAILFTAPSGTGKTTQTDLWHEYRTGVSDLNGDRTVLQKTDKGWYACGFPIYGSMVRCAQAAVPIRAIVVLRQAEMDTVRELSMIEKIMDLYSECTIMRNYPEDVEAAINLLENLVASETVVKLNCTMERSAVDVLHEYLYGEE
ncbi:MAG: hypothetical protein LUH07_13755 [Lachnospiraceae bacterium]|nr:hypothetical protein [Lachnospiraceae bacterium]